MHNVVKSFDSVEWTSSAPGIREKRIEIGANLIRLVELNSELDHPEWCETGHIGYVVDGSFVLDVNGEEHRLGKSDVFVVEDQNPRHRHIPIVPNEVTLLLIERAKC